MKSSGQRRNVLLSRPHILLVLHATGLVATSIITEVADGYQSIKSFEGVVIHELLLLALFINVQNQARVKIPTVIKPLL